MGTPRRSLVGDRRARKKSLCVDWRWDDPSDLRKPGVGSMSYELHAFIGRRQALSGFEGAPMQIISPAQSMALVPLTPALSGWLDQQHKGDRRVHPGFELLSEPVYQFGVRLSERSAVAYVEAFDFGNVGGQDAIVWQHGGVLMQPLHSYKRSCRVAGIAIVGSKSRGHALSSHQRSAAPWRGEKGPVRRVRCAGSRAASQDRALDRMSRFADVLVYLATGEVFAFPHLMELVKRARHVRSSLVVGGDYSSRHSATVPAVGRCYRVSRVSCEHSGCDELRTPG